MKKTILFIYLNFLCESKKKRAYISNGDFYEKIRDAYFRGGLMKKGSEFVTGVHHKSDVVRKIVIDSTKHCPEHPEREIALDLSQHVYGLKLTVIEAKELHLYICTKLKKHHYHGSLTDTDENDVIQTVCERVIIGGNTEQGRKWNKERGDTPLDFLKGCASSIIHAAGKSKKNKNQQKEYSSTNQEGGDYITPDHDYATPEEELISTESAASMLTMIANHRPALLSLAQHMILGEEHRPHVLTKILGITEQELLNHQRTVMRLIIKQNKGGI